MLQLRISQPGHEDRVVRLDRDEVVLGRAKACDVVIELGHVSKQHARLAIGAVLTDLGSANGTFVGGELVQGPVLVGPDGFEIGGRDSGVLVRVEGLGGPPDAALAAASEDLDAERRRAEALARELEAARGAVAELEARPDRAEEFAALERELRDARQRIASLKREVEERDVAASEALQARLALEAAEGAQRENDALRARVAELENQAAGPAVLAAKQALAARVAELEGRCAEAEETVRQLEGDLDRARAAGPTQSLPELFITLQKENARLRSQLAEPRAEPAAPGLFLELQAENRRLKAQVAELQAAPPPGYDGGTISMQLGDAAAADVDALQGEVDRLRAANAVLEREVAALRRARQAEPAAPRKIPKTQPGRPEGGLLKVVSQVVEHDVDGLRHERGGSLESFLLLELLTYTRRTEKFVTRNAGVLIGLYNPDVTQVPDFDGNLRSILGEMLDAQDDGRPRDALADYLAELKRWLVVALGAQKKSAERFAEQLKSDLSKRGLTAESPLPLSKRLGPLEEAELWRRTADYLKKLTPDVIEDRLRGFAVAAANDMPDHRH